MRNRSEVLQAAAVTLCAGTSLVAASCGSTGTARTLPAGAAAPNIVLPSDISAASPGSPQRTLLSWVQAVQFRDPGRVLQLTAPEVVSRIGSPIVTRAVMAIGPSFGRPQVVGSRIRGRLATLHVLLLSYAGDRAKPVLAIPITLRLKRDAGSWRMLDLAPLFPKGMPPAGRSASSAGAPTARSSATTPAARSSTTTPAGRASTTTSAGTPSGGSPAGARSGGSTTGPANGR